MQILITTQGDQYEVMKSGIGYEPEVTKVPSVAGVLREVKTTLHKRKDLAQLPSYMQLWRTLQAGRGVKLIAWTYDMTPHQELIINTDDARSYDVLRRRVMWFKKECRDTALLTWEVW